MRTIWDDMMNSKKLNVKDISELLGLENPPEQTGGTITKHWIVSAISATPGCEHIDHTVLGKQELLKAGLEAIGGVWDDECASEGSTITASALSRYAICLEPRLKEMREIWRLLGKDGYPSVNHQKFVEAIYVTIFNEEMGDNLQSSLAKILSQIDEEHGLSDEEITENGQPTRSAYQVIKSYFFTDDLEEEEDEEEDEVKRFVRTKVSATQIASLKNWYQNGMLDLNPPWQRGDVWMTKKKKSVMESIMLGIPLPALILHSIEDSAGRLRSIEVIDGQQRLRSMMYFMENQFPLSDFKTNHELHDSRKCYWNHPTKKSIDQEWRILIETTDVPILWFVNVEPKTLRKVFNLYNTAALKLNAAEIRNATYQTHKLHQMAFILAGENPDSEITYLEAEVQRQFTADWRDIQKSLKRFAATELICQYFAYSRPLRSGPVFKGSTTKITINKFLDHNRTYSSDDISELAQELLDCYQFTEDNFDLDNGINYSFFRNDKNGLAKPNKLITITNMVASRMLIKLVGAGIIDESAVRNAIEYVIPSVEFPDNQNAVTIWGYQATVIVELLTYFGIDSENLEVSELLPCLIPCMFERYNSTVE